jgi:uncharacterized cupredoxin-like copper-binding protein
VKARVSVRSPRLILLPFLALPLALAFLVPALAAGEGPATGAPATATAAVPTIEIKMEGKKMGFFGPKTIVEGETLRIVNTTNPAQVGPHTFSLVTKGSLPKTKAARKSCFTPGHICMAIAKWHKFNPKTEKVGKQLVEAGGEGWDTMGSLKSPGDSWFSGEKPGGSIEQVVTAKAGTKLYFMCAVHPFMQGSIKVEPKPSGSGY